MKQLEVDSASASSSNVTVASENQNLRIRKLDLGYFDNDPKSLDGFLSRFEVIAKAYNLPDNLYAIELSKTLQGPGLEVYQLLDSEGKMSYDTIVKALHKRFGITAGTYRRLFRTSKPYKFERLSDYVARLKSYLCLWLKKSELTCTYEGLFELITQTQFYSSMNKQTQNFLKEQGKMSLEMMIEKGQNFVDAHNVDFENNDSKQNHKSKQPFQKERKEVVKNEFAKNDSVKTFTKSNNNERTNKQANSEVVCWTCNEKGHRAAFCKNKNAEKKEKQHKSAVCQLDPWSTEIFPVIASCENQDEEEFISDLKFPHRGVAYVNGRKTRFLRDTGSSITLCRTSLTKPEDYTGKKVSVLLADKCVRFYDQVKLNISSPFYKGSVLGLSIESPVCDLVIGNDIFQSKNIPEINHDTDDVMIDECEKPFRNTVIFENSALIPAEGRIGHFDKHLECENEIEVANDADLSRPNSTPELINSQVSDCVENETNCAVQTRSQVKRESRKPKPLQHKVVDDLNVTSAEFEKLQKEDPTLQKYWKIAESNIQDDGKVHFKVKNGLLFRTYKNPSNDVTEQLVLPAPLRERAVKYAHETTLSGHMGISATYRKFTSVFFCPAAFDECKRVTKSCILCQSAGNRNTHGKAAMGALPTISTPFSVLFIDLIGKIEPASAEGHSYLLVILDAATNYVLAIPMKKTDSVSISEALMKVFNQFGYPKKIISDNASNFKSDLMKEVYRTFGIQDGVIPVFWPRANKVERYNASIIAILKKLIVHEPTQWHRYIDPLLFAIRTCPNSSGFSSFELLFGREARTHLTFLKELWSGQSTEPEQKVIYQYVLDLQNRIAETCQYAQQELAKIREKNFRYFNAKAKLRKFEIGQKVWVLNTKNEGKFHFNWIGPVEVIEKKGNVTYKLKFENGNERLYHVNMIKPYVTKEDMEKQTATKSKVGFSSQKIDTHPINTHTDDDCVSDDNDDDENKTMNESIETVAAVMGFLEISDDEDDNQNENDCSGKTQVETVKADFDIPNTRQTETWKDVQVNPDLSEDQKERVWSLLQEFKDIFSDVPTETNLITCKIKVKSEDPIRYKPYRIPYHLKEAVESEIDQMLKMGWIKHAESDYASPLVVVRKKHSNELRLCVSYKDLNNITVIDPTPMPEPEDVISQLGSSRYFSVCDAAKGFYAIRIEEESQKYTGFVFQNNHFVHTVLPFGLVNSPSLYSKLMQKLLYGAKNIANFVDDLITFTNSFDLHLKTLRDLFTRVRNGNIKLRPSKARIGYEEVTYLGHVVGHGKIRPTDETIDKVVNAPQPTTKKGVRSLCGIVNWVRKYVPQAARLLLPFNKLLTKNMSNSVNWGPEQQSAWEEIKRILTSKPVLTLYDRHKEHRICSDASQTFIGGVLLQLEDDQEWHPVFYVSRKCNKAELAYDIQNREALAVVWCCTKFYRFIYGKPFSLVVDSSAISILSGKPSNNARVRRWQLYLQSFQFRLLLVKTDANPIADFMSRLGT